jgi:uncharacterized delta-60 repeat protein
MRLRSPIDRLVASLASVLVATGAPLLAADGDLDPSFDGGAFTLAWSAGHARATVLEPIAAGELLVGGTVGDEPGETDGWAVAKLEADGTRELAWTFSFQIVSAGAEGMATTGDLFDMRRVANDRTMLAGWAYNGFSDMPMLARLGASGALDPTFDDNGVLLVDDAPAGWEEVDTRAATVLSDGRSVFVGDCESCPLEEPWVWIAVRLANGSPDLSFSGDGWHSFRFAADDFNGATAVAVDPDGRIVVAGENYLPFGDSSVYLVRLTASGAFDGSFGDGDGIAGPFDVPDADALAFDASSGRIATGGGSSGAPGAGHVRVYTNAGVPDTTFSADGHVDLDLEEGTSIGDVAFQSDGKLLALGTIDANGSNDGGFFFARMTTGGALDSTFDDNGVKRIEFDAAPDVRDRGYAVATMGGRFTAVGYAGEGGGDEEEMAVVRLDNALIFADGFERATAGGWSCS